MRLIIFLLMTLLVILTTCGNLLATDDPTSPDYIDLAALETPEFLNQVDEAIKRDQLAAEEAQVAVLVDVDDADAVI